jgi:hydroxymethylglutaryl-CoA reductase
LSTDHGSRIPGFYRLSLKERRAEIARRSGVDLESLTQAVETGGLAPETADKVVENVLGIYGMPLGIALNVQINGTDRLVPMVVEEPSVIAAASNAARMIRASGGFHAEMAEALMTTQVQVYDVPNVRIATMRLEAAREELLDMGARAIPSLVRRGGGPREIEVRDIGQGSIVVHVHVDCRDAMGANLVNGIAEAIGDRVADLTSGRLGLRILTNLCDRRRVHVRCRVHASELVKNSRPMRGSWAPEETLDGIEVINRIAQASRFAELDPYRATTHNKGIMNGIDAVVLATGNDFRAVEAGAHAFAARSGVYRPLATWRRDGGDLVGELEMPLALGIVGGTLRVHPVARLALDIVNVKSADELAMTAASVGMASNLAACRALATEGIQRGHMSLHARSVAIAAGATGLEVELIAAEIAEAGRITVDAAIEALERLKGQA